MRKTILSICNAEGWYAKLKIKGKVCFTPLSCWALTKSGKIEGLIIAHDGEEWISKHPKFLDYVHKELLHEEDKH